MRKHLPLLAASLLLALSTACDRREATETHGTAALEYVETTETVAPLEELAAVESLPEEPVEAPAVEVETLAAYEGPVQMTSIQPNENLVLLAEWANVSVEELLAANPDLDPLAAVYPGQAIALPIEVDGLSDFESARSDWLQGRLDRYLDRHGGLAGVREQRVRTGESAWVLATEEAGVPMWVFAAFNEGADLENLQIGQVVRVPLVLDQVELALEEDVAEPVLELETVEEVLATP